MHRDGDGEPRRSAAELEETFATIGNETRAEVLRVLGADPHTPLSFSELRSRLSGDVGSGQFNYHLDQLRGQFVTQTEDGYTLRPEGVILYRLVRAGTFTDEVSLDPFAVGVDCYFCGAPVEARYDTGILEMTCPDCAYQYGRTRLPPSAIDPENPRDALSLIDQYLRQDIVALSGGVCPYCVSAVDVAFVSEDDWMAGVDQIDVLVEYTCDHCGNQHYLSVGLSLLYHPSLVAFFDDHGVDVTSVPHWELEFAMTDNALTVRETDPWEVTLRITRDGETLVLTVDGDLTVLEDDRVSG